jgi:hypothetical protein
MAQSWTLGVTFTIALLNKHWGGSCSIILDVSPPDARFRLGNLTHWETWGWVVQVRGYNFPGPTVGVN